MNIKLKFNGFTLGLILCLVLVLITLLLKPSWQIGSDGFGYYSYVRSILFDYDLHLINEFQLFDSLYHHTAVAKWVTPIGELANPFAIGAAIAWTPFVALAKLYNYFWPASDPYDLSGFNLPFQIAVGLGTWFYTILGLILIFKTLSRLLAARYAWLATVALAGVSPIYYYLIYEPSMAHGLTVFTSALIFYFSVRIFEAGKLNYWLVAGAGLAVGLAWLVRWQDILIGLLPASLLIRQLYLNRPIKLLIACKVLLIFIAAFSLLAWLQLGAWKILYGSWWVVPQGQSFFHWTDPHFWSFLFSGYHGLFIIHPLLILGLVGLIFVPKKYLSLTILCFLTWLLEFYLNGSLADWYGGGSFGARRMISVAFVLIFGLAWLFKKISQSKALIYFLIVLIFLGIIFNGLLMIAYAQKIIPLDQPTTRLEIYNAPIKTILNNLPKLKVNSNF